MRTGGHGSQMGTEVRVVDRDYCHRDVAIFRIPNQGMSHYSTAAELAQRREKARVICAALNRENELERAA